MDFSDVFFGQTSIQAPNSMLRPWVMLLGQESGNMVLESLKMLFILLAPFIAFAIIIHWMEFVTQRRLAERFGWKSILWTGWLGTPIHELSHVFMCRVFQHKVHEIALFEPDRESGRLGYVKHSLREGNWYQELGSLFIGIAPLMGGSLVLAALLWMFYPEAITAALESSQDEQTSGALAKLYGMVRSLLSNILTIPNLGTIGFWTFIYLVLCVGSHMAPSGSDYRGALRGVYWMSGILLVTVVVLSVLGFTSDSLVDGMIGVMGPLYAILGLTIVLCGITTALVWGVTTFLPKRYRLSD